MFVEDSIGDRVWVDLEQCKKLVDNICITFQTKQSSSPQSGEGGAFSVKPVGGDSAVGATGTSGSSGGSGEREDTAGTLLLTDVDVEPR